ncbi:hypothetical protein [Ruminococcus sp.]|uniref:hypothetical protein n=1 Tax=Ruminococcus sp. TaxID=41978 RepID=UPI0035294D00
MDEYAAVVKRFYAIYLPLGRKYNLNIYSKFKVGRPGIIKIYQGDWPKQNQIINVERDEDIDCYKRAIEELESWVRSREDENKRYRTA